VTVVPTNRTCSARTRDVVYKNRRGKFRAVVDRIVDCHQRGQPWSAPSVEVESSRRCCARRDPHNVLNAKQHEKEAHVVAQAGRKGAVTISTNMAGRGTDIILGGNAEFMARAEIDPENAGKPGHEWPPEQEEAFRQGFARFKAQCDAEKQEVLAAGGLHILGTERHESRRIDNQLRGRAGRQGDPGSSRFYMSLEDDLMRIFAAERVTKIMEFLGMEEDVPIEHPWINKAIEGAQKKVEGHNFDIRKNLLEYDDVMNQQRRTIYKLRRRVLAAGAGVALVEYDENPKTKVKVRSEHTVSWEDFREMLLDALEDVVLAQTGAYASANNPDTWDVPALTRSVKDNLNLEMGFQNQGSRDELQEQIYQAAEKVLRSRERSSATTSASSPGTATWPPSTSCGRTTCWRWTTSARASGCAPTGSAIRSRPTRRKATTGSCRCWGRSTTS
jgi:preprotein translocase subunit SecA